MNNVCDPEIPVSIVELGLVYQCEVSEKEKGRYDVFVEMTLTAPGCGMGDVLLTDAKTKIKLIQQIDDIGVKSHSTHHGINPWCQKLLNWKQECFKV